MNLYQLKKIGRIVAKVILGLGIAGLIGYVGYSLFLSIYYKPKFVTVTNITGNSATISWITDVPLTGSILYKTEDNILPWPLSLFNTEKAYDDRDFNNAEFEMYSENPIATEDVKVKDLGKYKAHHITLRDLDENSSYYFVIQNGWYTFRVDISNIKTYSTPTTAPTPQPIFGSVVDESGNPISNSIVYITPAQKGTDMNVLSAVTNGMGGWYVDISSTRNSNGDIVTLEESNDTFKAFVRLDSEYYSDIQDYVFGYFDGGYEDILVKKQENINSLNILNRLIGEVEAQSYIEEGQRAIEKAKSLETYNLNQAKTVAPSYVTESQIKTVISSGNNSNQSDSDKKKAAELVKNVGITYVLKIYKAATGKDIDAKTYENLTGGSIKFSSANINASAGINVTNFSEDASYDPTSKTYVPKASDPGSVVVKSTSSVTCSSGNCNISIGDTFSASNIPIAKAKKILEDLGINLKSEDSSSPYTRGVYSANLDNVSDETIGKVISKFLDENSDKGETSISTKLRKCENLSSCFKATAEANTKSIVDADSVFSLIGINDILNSALDEQVASYLESGSCGSNSASVSLKSSGSVVVNCKDSKGKVVGRDFLSQKEAISILSKVDVVLGDSVIKVTNSEELSSFKDLITKNNFNQIDFPISYANTMDDLQEEFGTNYGTPSDPAVFSQLVNDEKFKECINTKCNEDVVKLLNKFKSEQIGVSFKAILDANSKLVIVYDNSYKAEEESTKEESSLPSKGFSLVSKAYASDNTSNSDSGYIYYLPEKGLYDIQIGDESLGKTISNDGTGYIFYLEINGIDGLQVPDDPENPKYWEDIIFDSSALGVKYSKVSDTFDINLKKGINLISFDFVPSRSKTEVYTSSQLILDATQSGIRLEYVSYFDSGKWSTGIKCTDSTCMGNNFVIVPGQGYLLYASEDGTLSVPGYDLESSAPISLYEGWNLVGINGYEKQYTAKSLLTSINSITGMTADNVTWWPTALGRYTGFEYANGKEYGTDYAIFDNNAYFIRVTDLKPSNTKCTAIIWQEGGTLHGTCGSTSSVKSSTSQVTTNNTVKEASSLKTVYLKSSDVKNVTLNYGDTLIVQSTGIAGTGYSFEDPIYDKTYLTLTSTNKTNQYEEGTDGGETLYEWHFNAIKKGSSNLTINYSRSWEKESTRVEKINATITIK